VNLVDRGGRCSSNVPFYDAYGWMGGMFDWNYQMVLNSMMNSMMSGGINGEQAVSTLSGYENMCVPIYEAQYPISGGGSATSTGGSNSGSTTTSFSTSINLAKSTVTNNLSAYNLYYTRPSCLNLFNTLGISVQDFLTKLSATNFVDASVSNTLFTSQTWASGESGYQGWANAQLYTWGLSSNLSVQDVFNQRQSLMALSLPFGNNVFVRNTSVITPEILMHEVLHKFGTSNYDDRGIQTKLGIAVSSNTDNITQKIKTDCF